MTTTTTAPESSPAFPVIAPPPATGNIDLQSLAIEGDFALVDVETTGVDPEVDRIIEIAILRRRGDQFEQYSTLINPGVPIPPTCSAITHITDEDVVDAPTLEEVLPHIELALDGAIKVAHNAAFDSMFVDPALGLEPSAGNWLCTFRAARHLMPLAPAFGNQVLRYWLKTRPATEGLGAHRAMDDVHVTRETLSHILKLAHDERGARTVAEVRALANEPIQVDVLPFGKHAGKRLEEVPQDYFDWALKNMKDLDADLKSSIEREMERRAADGDAKPAAKSAPKTEGKPESTDEPLTVMPFGKHAGKPLADVPVSYFEWALENMNRLDERIRTAMQAQIDQRRGAGESTGQSAAKASSTVPAATASSAPASSGSGSPTLPFGMHRGTPVDEVPLDYLRYLASSANFGERMPDGLKDAIVDSIARRGASQETGVSQAARPTSPASSRAERDQEYVSPSTAAAVGRYAERAASMPQRGSFFGLSREMAETLDDGGLPPEPEPEPAGLEPSPASSAPRSASFARRRP